MKKFIAKSPLIEQWKSSCENLSEKEYTCVDGFI